MGVQEEGKMSLPTQKPLFDDCRVQRDSPEKRENKSEASYKIGRAQKTSIKMREPTQ